MTMVTAMDVSNPRAAELLRKRAVIINGRFLTQRTTGVQRYAHQILSAMSEILEHEAESHDRLSFSLAVPGDLQSPLPDYLSFAAPRAGRRRGYAWEQFELSRTGDLTLNLCNLAPLLGRRKVVCIHDANTVLAPYSYNWKYRAFQRVSMPLLGRTASAVTTVSHASARALAECGAVRDASAVVVAPNGHEHALAWRPEASSLDPDRIGQRPFVVMLGSLAPHKNLALVQTIAPELAARGIDCFVTGKLDAVFARSASEAHGPIRPLGFVSDDDIALLFSRAVCLLFPSYVEGFGLPIVEAMALGCPVVASDRSCMPEICGDAALLRPPDDAAAWIEAVCRLANEPDLRANQIRAGRARVQLYSWRSSARIYLELLDRLTRDSRAS